MEPNRSPVVAGPSAALPSGTIAPPPHPLDGQWHLHLDGQTYGPYTGHQLAEFVREGRVLPTTQVLLDGTESWLAAADDARLRSIFREAAKPPPPISAAAGATVVQVTNQINPGFVLPLEALETKSPGLALVLSLLFCGVGQMYNGQVAKGILMLIGCVVLWLVALGWIISIWSMIDAYRTAKAINLRALAYRLPAHAA